MDRGRHGNTWTPVLHVLVPVKNGIGTGSFDHRGKVVVVCVVSGINYGKGSKHVTSRTSWYTS